MHENDKLISEQFYLIVSNFTKPSMEFWAHDDLKYKLIRC